MATHFVVAPCIQENLVSEAFNNLLSSKKNVAISSEDGNFSLINSSVLRFASPLINSIFQDTLTGESNMIIIPDANKIYVECVLSIITRGFRYVNNVSEENVKDIVATANMLGIKLDNLETRLSNNNSPIRDVEIETDFGNSPLSPDISCEFPDNTLTKSSDIAPNSNDLSWIKKERLDFSDPGGFISGQNDKSEEYLEDLNIKLEHSTEQKEKLLELVPSPPPALVPPPQEVKKASSKNFALVEESILSIIKQLDNNQPSPMALTPPPQEDDKVVEGEVGFSTHVIDEAGSMTHKEPNLDRSDRRSKSSEKNLSGSENNKAIKRLMKLAEEKPGPRERSSRGVSEVIDRGDIPRSKKASLQYVYEYTFHSNCGATHRRIDLCGTAKVHDRCGTKHSFAMECDGKWMSLEKFEAVASRWPDTKTKLKEIKKARSKVATALRKSSTLSRSKIVKRTSPSPRQRSHGKADKTMSEFEKMLDTCLVWNTGRCKDCNKQHRCSKMIKEGDGDERICWGGHKEWEHGTRFKV